MNKVWKNWDTDPAQPGDKIVIICNDGSSSALAYVIDGDGNGTPAPLEAEDGYDLRGTPFMKGQSGRISPRTTR